VEVRGRKKEVGDKEDNPEKKSGKALRKKDTACSKKKGVFTS